MTLEALQQWINTAAKERPDAMARVVTAARNTVAHWTQQGGGLRECIAASVAAQELQILVEDFGR